MVHHKKIRIRGRSVKKKRHRKARKDWTYNNQHLLNKNHIISPDTDIKKFRIAVIESLPEGEIHTGTKLYEGELKPLTLSDESRTASLHIVKDKTEFKKSIRDIIDSLSGDELVTLHVEAHGAEEKGIQLSSGEFLGWKDFMDNCRILNEVLNGLLIVTLSMCNSLPVLGCVDPTKRAPFKAILLTNRNVTVDEVERGFIEFYNNYKNPLDVFKATDLIRNEVKNGDGKSIPFHLLVADTIFDWFVDLNRDPDGFAHIVNENFCRLKSINPEYTRERTEEEIRGFINDLAKNGRDYFLYWDIVKKYR